MRCEEHKLADLAGVSVAAQTLSEAWADTVLLTYEPRLLLLEALLHSPRRPLDVRNVIVLCAPDHLLHVFQQVSMRSCLQSRVTSLQLQTTPSAR